MQSIGQIIKIIDHHKPSVKLSDASATSSMDIEIDETVGSCSTLVAKRYFQSLSDETAVDVQVALLLYGPVILGEFAYW